MCCLPAMRLKRGVTASVCFSNTAAADGAAGHVLQHKTRQGVQNTIQKHHSLPVKPTESLG